MNLELLDQRCETYINDLDDALTIVERVVVNTEGAMEYLPPFAYLQAVRDRVNEVAENTSENLTPNEKDDHMVACSSECLTCEA